MAANLQGAKWTRPLESFFDIQVKPRLLCSEVLPVEARSQKVILIQPGQVIEFYFKTTGSG